jgi:hypothetical protein
VSVFENDVYFIAAWSIKDVRQYGVEKAISIGGCQDFRRHVGLLTTLSQDGVVLLLIELLVMNSSLCTG